MVRPPRFARIAFFGINVAFALLVLVLGIMNVALPNRIDRVGGLMLIGMSVPYAVCEVLAFWMRKRFLERMLGIANLAFAIVPLAVLILFVVAVVNSEDSRMLVPFAWRFALGCVVVAYLVVSGASRLKWSGPNSVT